MKKILSTIVLTSSLAMSGTAMAGAFFTTAQDIAFDFGTNLNQTVTLSFDGFDSSLGTLTSVHLDYILDETLNNTVFNTTGTAQSVGTPTPLSATSTTDFSVVGQNGLLSLAETNTLTTPIFSGTVGPSSSEIVVGQVSSTNRPGSVWICTDASCLAQGGNSVADLSSYIGGVDLFNIAISGVSSQGGSVPPNVFTGNNGTRSGTLSITYDYDVIAQPPVNNVPEPTTVALLGLGFSLLGFQSFARKRKQA